jgi:hypothetical protein
MRVAVAIFPETPRKGQMPRKLRQDEVVDQAGAEEYRGQ